MSEQSTESTEQTEQTETTESTEQTQAKPTETVEFWKQKAREQEKRAKENATAAKRLGEIEDAQKSEAEKSAERIRQLETEVEDSRRNALRFKVASKFGIDDEDTELFLTGSDEETLKKQAERLSERKGERKKQGNHVAREGNTTASAPNDERAFVRGLFGSGG